MRHSNETLKFTISKNKIGFYMKLKKKSLEATVHSRTDIKSLKIKLCVSCLSDIFQIALKKPTCTPRKYRNIENMEDSMAPRIINKSNLRVRRKKYTTSIKKCISLDKKIGKNLNII
jgi:hypothetical protein